MSSINPDIMKHACLKGADDAMFFPSSPAEISCYNLLFFCTASLLPVCMVLVPFQALPSANKTLYFGMNRGDDFEQSSDHGGPIFLLQGELMVH